MGERPPVGPRELVSRLGRHPLAEWELDPNLDDAGLWRWFLSACLLSGRDAPRARDLVAALEARGLGSRAALAAADAPRLASDLEGLGARDPAALAGRLVRSARALEARHAGSLGALLRGAADLEELAAQLGGLAPGVGAATVARFLRGLRDRFDAAREVPLAPSARAAALCLGWLAPGQDEEGEPVSLRRALARSPDAPELADAEAALERLGRAACSRRRPSACPLAASCPAREGRLPNESRKRPEGARSEAKPSEGRVAPGRPGAGTRS
jgi:hypothetical protein